jgi:uncharacterized protein YcfJ
MRTIVAAMLLLCLTKSTHASPPPEGDEYTAYANVVSAQPIYDRQQVKSPVQQCRWEHAPDVTRRYLSNGQPQYVRKRIKRCHTRIDVTNRQTITGYRVRLAYNGIEFNREMPQAPPARVPIVVDIRP